MPPPKDRVNSVRRAWLATVGLSWALGAAGPAAADSGCEIQDFDWVDAARKRRVPVRLYRPATDMVRGAELPLALFSHGFGGTRHDAVWLGTALARAGVACLHVQHVGSDLRSWLMGPVDWTVRELRGDLARERVARALDLRFALDRLLAGDAGLAVDRKRVAALGHSLGGQTALLLGGAALQGSPPLRDERITAVAAFGMAAFAGQDTRAALRSVAVPSLHVTTEEDSTWAPGYAASPNDRATWFRSSGNAFRVLVVFKHGSHAVFNDAETNDPLGAAAGELVQHYLGACWTGDLQALQAWRTGQAAKVTRFELISESARGDADKAQAPQAIQTRSA